MNSNIDYINLMDVAKINLAKKINDVVDLYKKEKTIERKQELINLIEDRKRIFLFDKITIEKYL